MRKWVAVCGYLPKPESKNIQRDPQNPLHDSTEFYVQCAIKFVHKHEKFRRKPLEGKGRGSIREGKEGAHPDILSRGPRVPSYAADPIMKSCAPY